MTMREGHGRFAVINRTANPVLRALLSSPLHRVASDRLALVTYTGRRSGRPHTIPVGYQRSGDNVTITVGWADRKVWWRNLTGEGGPVELVIGGRRLAGHAVARGQGDRAVVEVKLDEPRR